MKILSIFASLLVTGVVCFVSSSCKKDSSAPLVFTATVDNDVYSFDSLFAWIDTGSASLHLYYVNIGAKNTKENNSVYLQGVVYPDKSFSGTYNYTDHPPYPLPATYQLLEGFSGVLNTGANKGIFHLGGSNLSHFSVDKVEESKLQGSFSLRLYPTFSDGSTDSSHLVLMMGQFNLPYHYKP